MTEPTRDNLHPQPAGNLGVHLGTLLVLIAFCLPWVAFGNLSALKIALFREDAEVAALALNLSPEHVTIVTRMLFMVPLLAIATLVVELSVPPRSPQRMAARLSVLCAGGALTTMFASVGIRMGSMLTYGFWAAMMGAMFITVGALFNVFRDE